MKRLIAALALAAAAMLPSACGREAEKVAEATLPDERVESAADNATQPDTSRPARVDAPGPAGPAAAPGAPPFAVLYPGASLDTPALIASDPAGNGGLVTYSTDASPDAVVAFYRARAEGEGLSSVMAMNQGEARAYGAAAAGAGDNLQVVAAPTDAGDTSVQLSWSVGQ